MASKVTFQFTDEEPAAPESYQFVDEPVKREWKASDIAREPLAIASEVGAGLLNLPVKAAKGIAGLGTLAMGGSLEDATNTIGNRNAITSPWKSKTFEALGENVISPAVNKVADVTGLDPSTVAAFAEAGGDVATLIGMGWGAGSPSSVVSNRLGNAAKVTADKTGNGLMAMTLKQPVGLDKFKRAQNVRTAFEGNFMPTVKGSTKLDTEIGSLESLLDQGLARGESQGVNGSFQQALNNVDGLRGQAMNTGSPTHNLGLIDEELARLQGNPNLGGIPGQPLEVPIRKMQDMKVQQGRDLQKKYGEEKPQFQTAIDKARVRGFKEELENKLDVAFPELAATNQKLGTYYQLKKSLDNAVNRINNNQGVGIGMPIKAGTGAAMGGMIPGVGAAAGGSIGMLVGLIEHPAIAPLLARQLYKVNKGKMTHRQALDEVNARMLSVAGGTAAYNEQ